MLTIDLRPFICPQQFVQFKLGLNRAAARQENICFLLPLGDKAKDIKTYLIKRRYDYIFREADKHIQLTVEFHLGV